MLGLSAEIVLPTTKQIAFSDIRPVNRGKSMRWAPQGGAPELLYRSATNLADPSWSPGWQVAGLWREFAQQSRVERSMSLI